MKNLILKLGIIAFACALLVATFQKPSFAGFKFMHDATSVVLDVRSGAPPSRATAPTVTGSVPAAMQIVPATTTRYVSVDKRTVLVNVAPGGSATVSCAFRVAASANNAAMGWALYSGATNDLSSSNGSVTHGIMYRSYVAGASPSGSFRPFANLSSDGEKSAPVAVGRAPTMYCVDLQVKLPSAAGNGDHYSTLSYLLYTGAPPGRATPTPSPSPTPLPTPTPYDAVILQDHPDVYYRLDETPAPTPTNQTLYDVSGHNENAIFTAPASNNWASTSGALNNSADTAIENLATNGGNYARNYTYGATTTGFSIEAWFKSSTTGAINDIYDPYDVDCSNTFGLAINNPRYPVPYGYLIAHFGPPINGSGFGVISKDNVTDGAWHHIVAEWYAPAGSVVTASDIHIYVDGQDETGTAQTFNGGAAPVSPLVENGAQSGECPGPAFQVGVYGGFNLFEGTADFSLDELALYSYELTPTQILTHYHAAGY